MFSEGGLIPIKNHDQFKKILEINTDECPLTHLRSKIKSVYLANKNFRNWDASWRFLKYPWLTYAEFGTAIGLKIGAIEINKDRVNKFESIYPQQKHYP
jgi:hypothetical protein